MIYLSIGLLLGIVPFCIWAIAPLFEGSRKSIVEIFDEGLLVDLAGCFSPDDGPESVIEYLIAGFMWSWWCAYGLIIFLAFATVWPILVFSVPGVFIFWVRHNRLKRSADETVNKA